jgi:hypothetical protein
MIAGSNIRNQGPSFATSQEMGYFFKREINSYFVQLGVLVLLSEHQGVVVCSYRTRVFKKHLISIFKLLCFRSAKRDTYVLKNGELLKAI